MLRGFFGNLIFAIIARMLCGNHLNLCLNQCTSSASLYNFFPSFFFQERPGEAVLSVIIPKVTTASVAWCYSPGADEAPTSITLHYWNSTFSSILNLQPGSSFFTVLTQLKPFAHYSVKVRASSVLGDGLWSTAMNFTTLAEGKYQTETIKVKL